MTTRTACCSAVLVTMAAGLSAATLGLAVAPAAGAADLPSRRVFDLPAVRIVAQRTASHVAVIDLPQVVVSGHRLQPMAVIDLPPVRVTASRVPEAATVVVAGR